MCYTYCFSDNTLDTRTRLSVTLYVHCLSCFKFKNKGCRQKLNTGFMPNTIFPFVHLMVFQQNSVIVTEYVSSLLTSSDFAPVNGALQRIGFDAKRWRRFTFLLSLFPPQNIVIPSTVRQGLFVKPAFLMKQAKFCDIIRGHYSLTWSSVYFESWPHFRIYLCVHIQL